MFTKKFWKALGISRCNLIGGDSDPSDCLGFDPRCISVSERVCPISFEPVTHNQPWARKDSIQENKGA